MEKYLLPNEKIISKKEKKDFIFLTNLRLRQVGYKKRYLKTVLLENITAVQYSYKSYRIFLFIALLFFGATIFVLRESHNSEDALFPFGLVLLFILIYFLTRKYFISVSSFGDVFIEFYIAGVSKDKIISYVNDIEQAIVERKEYLFYTDAKTMKSLKRNVDTSD